MLFNSTQVKHNFRQDRIIELEGPNYHKIGPKMLDREGKELPGSISDLLSLFFCLSISLSIFLSISFSIFLSPLSLKPTFLFRQQGVQVFWCSKRSAGCPGII